MEQITEAAPIESPMISQELFKKILSEVSNKGLKVCPDFSIKSEQENYYVNLYLYFSRTDSCIWDLKKGLIVAGTVGTGKTLSLKIMQSMFKNFGMVNTRHVVRDFLHSGISIIDKYGRDSFKHNGPHGSINYKTPITWCFDDFGQENTNTKLWGNQVNIIEEIFCDRYEKFEEHGLITHATCNVDPELIEDAYGKRVRDRLRKMMNYIALTGPSKR